MGRDLCVVGYVANDLANTLDSVSGELLFGPRFLIPTQCNNVTFSAPAWRGLRFIFLNVADFKGIGAG